jgi:hypothetical protein
MIISCLRIRNVLLIHTEAYLDPTSESRAERKLREESQDGEGVVVV